MQIKQQATLLSNHHYCIICGILNKNKEIIFSLLAESPSWNFIKKKNATANLQPHDSSTDFSTFRPRRWWLQMDKETPRRRSQDCKQEIMIIENIIAVCFLPTFRGRRVPSPFFYAYIKAPGHERRAAALSRWNLRQPNPARNNIKRSWCTVISSRRDSRNVTREIL